MSMTASEALDAAKLAGLVVAAVMAWKAYQAVKSGAQKLADLPGDLWSGLSDWGSSFSQVPSYSPEFIANAQEQFGAWTPGRGTVTKVKKTQPTSTATQETNDAWAAAKDAAYGQKSFTDLVNQDPYNFFPTLNL